MKFSTYGDEAQSGVYIWLFMFQIEDSFVTAEINDIENVVIYGINLKNSKIFDINVTKTSLLSIRGCIFENVESESLFKIDKVLNFEFQYNKFTRKIEIIH